jgi:1,4-alpha-glucan branching enzyme
MDAMTSVKPNGSIEFRFYRPGVRDVRVVGCFNGWCTSPLNALRMRPAGDGWWVATATLPPGDHRFRYVADGQWYTDYAANGIEHGKLGINSLLFVPKLAGSEGKAKRGSTKRARMVA